ncbi:hypothetical protein NMY22_g4301 [Coprinellus aureogranulatus]|nr:hypothetical protein NMY22_g4301 [Coprinellus aureogranulatus]
MSSRPGYSSGSSEEDEESGYLPMRKASSRTPLSSVLRGDGGLSNWSAGDSSPPMSTSISWHEHCRLASIDALPQELLAEILREYLRSSVSDFPRPKTVLGGSFSRIRARPDAATTPFTLGQVCSSWRKIVNSNPFIWPSVCADQAKPSDVPLFELWLSRSSSRPLDLTISQRQKYEWLNEDTSSSGILSCAIRHSHRWKIFNLDAVDRELEIAFTPQSLPLGSLPLLEECSVETPYWNPEANRYLSQLLFSSPALRTITIGPALGLKAVARRPSWSPLTTIHVMDVEWSELSALLRQTPQLCSLTIATLHAKSNSITSSPIMLRHLSELFVHYYPNITPLFQSLSTPSLSELFLTGGMGTQEHGHHEAGLLAFLGFVERSGCRLRSLTWLGNDVPQRDTIQFLEVAGQVALLGLKDLAIGSPAGGSVARALTLRPEVPLFSSLESLDFHNFEGTDAHIRALIDSRPNLTYLRVAVDWWTRPSTFSDSQFLGSGRPNLKLKLHYNC